MAEETSKKSGGRKIGLSIYNAAVVLVGAQVSNYVVANFFPNHASSFGLTPAPKK